MALRAQSSLIARFAAGPLDGLFQILRGQHPEEHRHAAVQRDVSDALGDLAAHVVVVGWLPRG